MIKVLVADDSLTVRQWLKVLLQRDGGMEVIGLAADGEEAVKMAVELNPDVVVMDVYMPKLDGFEATRRLMATHPLPIVLCSAAWGPAEVDKTMKAMQAGAVTIVAKPHSMGLGGSALNDEHQFVQTIKSMAGVEVVRRFSRSGLPVEQNPPLAPASGQQRDLVVIGSSTGGPPALQAILARLPQNFLIPIVIVQHIANGFLPGFVGWLAGNAKMGVKIAENGEEVKPGQVYFAPNNLHLGLTAEGRVNLDQTAPPEANLRPSIAYLFRTVAQSYGPRAVGILLTGMGRDGAEQLKAMRDAGALTIVQDKESSVVYGMPQEAKRIGAAQYEMSPLAIGDFLAALADRQKKRT
jgi:two-component system chemotaxis response regulator CheB